MDQGAIRKGLLVFAAANLLIAAAFWLWNPEPDARARQSGGKSIAQSALAAVPKQSSADNAGIVAANIFSASRTPPGRRYNPADDELSDPGESAAPMNIVEVSAPPHLFGTVVGPAGAMALMQSDSAGGPGRLYREGEKIGSYRLLKVKANSVIMSGPSGRLEIQVQRSPTGA